MDNKFTLLSRQRCRWAAGTTLAVVAAGSPLMVANAAFAVGTGTVNVHVASNSGGAARLSVTAMRKPLRCRWRATDRPVRPMPTTTAFGACETCGLI